MEDDGGGGGGGRRSLRYEFSREPNGSTAGLTLGGILSIKEASSYRIQNRTLLDLIRNDPTSGNELNDSKKSWKMFREKLRLKLAGSVCTTTTPILASLVHINTDNNRTTTENGTNLLNSPSVSTINGVPVTQTANSTNLLNSPPVSHINTSSVPVTQPESRTNLLHTDTNTSGVPVTQTANYMDQLNSPWVSNSGSVTVTQTVNSTNQLNSRPVSNSNTSSVPDTQTVNVRSEPPVEEYERTTTAEESRDGGDGGGVETVKMSLMSLLEVEGSAYFYEEEVAEGGGGGGGGGGEYNNCCVCMVRHKGAAFIPCGHTFCRLCSRELFVKRANCPLCNNFILEILDIF